jgi:prophage regulatory protein
MKLLGFNDLKEKKGINWSRVHVSRQEKAGKFPKHVNLAPQSIGWIEEEIDAWIEARAAERSEKPAQIAGQRRRSPAGLSRLRASIGGDSSSAVSDHLR